MGRFVVDTNVLVSRLLSPNSVPAMALARALETGKLLASDETIDEVIHVLARPKFRPYLTIEEAGEFVRLVEAVAERVGVIRRIRACRDPKDDKFLELAVAGEAAAIISGDQDLLAMNPFEGVEILTPAEFVAQNRT